MGTTVRHTQHSWLIVQQLKILIWERSPIDGTASCSVSLFKVAALAHELRDDSVKD